MKRGAKLARNAEIRSRSGALRTSRGHPGSAVIDPMYGPAVRCKRKREVGYQVSNWSSCSGPSWDPRAPDLISGQASKGAIRVISSRVHREDHFSISSFLSQTSVRKTIRDLHRGSPCLEECLDLTGGRSLVRDDDEHGSNLTRRGALA
jgi:hypothetical protein